MTNLYSFSIKKPKSTILAQFNIIKLPEVEDQLNRVGLNYDKHLMFHDQPLTEGGTM